MTRIISAVAAGMPRHITQQGKRHQQTFLSKQIEAVLGRRLRPKNREENPSRRKMSILAPEFGTGIRWHRNSGGQYFVHRTTGGKAWQVLEALEAGEEAETGRKLVYCPRNWVGIAVHWLMRDYSPIMFCSSSSRAGRSVSAIQPSFLMMRPFSTVVRIGLITDGFKRPACCQS